MKKEPLILIGGGGHCKSCLDVIELEGVFEVIGILDMPKRVGMAVLGNKIIGVDEDISRLAKTVKFFFITVGQISSPDKRIKLYELLHHQKNIEIPVIISPRAHVSKHSRLGKGTIVMHNATINADTIIGENCIINTNSLIEHDCVVEDHCHISTGAIVNGSVNIGMGTFIGSGAVTNNNCIISPRSFIKANSLHM